jgi:hypothetical protein
VLQEKDLIDGKCSLCRRKWASFALESWQLFCKTARQPHRVQELAAMDALLADDAMIVGALPEEGDVNDEIDIGYYIKNSWDIRNSKEFKKEFDREMEEVGVKTNATILNEEGVQEDVLATLCGKPRRLVSLSYVRDRLRFKVNAQILRQGQLSDHFDVQRRASMKKRTWRSNQRFRFITSKGLLRKVSKATPKTAGNVDNQEKGDSTATPSKASRVKTTAIAAPGAQSRIPPNALTNKRKRPDAALPRVSESRRGSVVASSVPLLTISEASRHRSPSSKRGKAQSEGASGGGRSKSGRSNSTIGLGANSQLIDSNFDFEAVQRGDIDRNFLQGV